jgi:prolipoprotein diacylglyceryltransferase
MEQYSRAKTLKKLFISIIILVIITAALVASYLIYKGNFNSISYSNWLFYSSMLYISLGGLSSYGSFMATNSYSYKYASTVMYSNYETRKKTDDMLMNNSLNFSIRMIAIGLLLLTLSAAADKFL